MFRKFLDTTFHIHNRCKCKCTTVISHGENPAASNEQMNVKMTGEICRLLQWCSVLIWYYPWHKQWKLCMNRLILPKWNKVILLCVHWSVLTTLICLFRKMALIKLDAFESFITRSSSNHFVQATESRESKTVNLRWFLLMIFMWHFMKMDQLVNSYYDEGSLLNIIIHISFIILTNKEYFSAVNINGIFSDVLWCWSTCMYNKDVCVCALTVHFNVFVTGRHIFSLVCVCILKYKFSLLAWYRFPEHV